LEFHSRALITKSDLKPPAAECIRHGKPMPRIAIAAGLFPTDAKELLTHGYQRLGLFAYDYRQLLKLI
jgi:hypothetical protein